MQITSEGAASAAAAVDLDKLVKLFTNDNSKDLHDRHIAALERLCKSRVDGVAIRDLPRIRQVFELTAELVAKGHDQFVQPLCALLRCLSKPYIKRTSTDEFKMLNNISDFLGSLGRVYEGDFPLVVQFATSELLAEFSTAYGNRPTVLELASSSSTDSRPDTPRSRQYHKNQGLITRSRVVYSVVRGLGKALVAAEAPLVRSLLYTLVNFSYAADNCSQMVEAGVVQHVIVLLQSNFKDELVPPAVDLLWNILEFDPEAKLAIQGFPVSTKSYHNQQEGAEEESNSPQHEAAIPVEANENGVASENGEDEPSITAAEERPASTTNSRSASPVTGASDKASDAGPTADESAEVVADAEAEASAETAADGDAEQLDGAEGESAPEQPLQSVAENEGEQQQVADGPSEDQQEGQDDGGRPLAPEEVVIGLAGALSSQVRALLLSGFRVCDKELRNNMMMVVNLLLEEVAFQEAFVAEGLLPPLLAAATCPELGERVDLVKQYALTTDELDFELRQLSWAALALCCERESSRPAVVDSGFIRVLLMYSDVTESSPAVTRWNADQMTVLRSAALSRLHRVAPLLPDEYVAARGCQTLIHFLARCTNQSHTEAALRHLHALCCQAEGLREVLGAEGLLGALLDIVQATHDRLEPVRHFALLLLAVMCAGHPANQKRLRKAQGVQVFLAQLVKLTQLDPTLPSPFALAALDAIWNCVVPDRKNMARFLVNEGMDGLLNFLERGNKHHRPVLLSLISDMLENTRSHSFFHDWRSEISQGTAAHLLIVFWKEEDALRGMSSEGVLSAPVRPLAGLGTRQAWVTKEAVVYGNLQPRRKAELDSIVHGVSGDMLLGKIYACFKLLGFENFDYLIPEDQAVLCFIEKYVKFRQGEVWQDIKAAFEAEGMRPTAPDRERLISGIELSEHLALAVRDSQAAVLGRHHDSLVAAETQFFEAMRTQRRLEHEARFYQKDRSQLTLRELQEAKAKREAMLRNSIRSFQHMDVETDEEPNASPAPAAPTADLRTSTSSHSTRSGHGTPPRPPRSTSGTPMSGSRFTPPARTTSTPMSGLQSSSSLGGGSGGGGAGGVPREGSPAVSLKGEGSQGPRVSYEGSPPLPVPGVRSREGSPMLGVKSREGSPMVGGRSREGSAPGIGKPPLGAVGVGGQRRSSGGVGVDSVGVDGDGGVVAVGRGSLGGSPAASPPGSAGGRGGSGVLSANQAAPAASAVGIAVK